MASRKIEDLTPYLQELYWLWDAEMKKAGLKYIITCTARKYQEQFALFAQGRESLTNVNHYRFLAGMLPITAPENEHCVTWTMNSKHIINLEDSVSGNDKSRAFDYAIVKNGKPVWDLKVNVNNNDLPDYAEARKIALSVGLKIIEKDFPHLEI